MGRLAGKVAFITGATSGIGRAAAAVFASEGPAVAAIHAAGGVAAFFAMDVGAPDSAQSAIDAAAAQFGGLDILYNNAGGSSAADGPVTEGSLDEFWRCIRVDLFGTFLGCRFAISHLRKRGGGSIINSASVMGAMGLPNRDAYTAAKGGRYRADAVPCGGICSR